MLVCWRGRWGRRRRGGHELGDEVSGSRWRGGLWGRTEDLGLDVVVFRMRSYRCGSVKNNERNDEHYMCFSTQPHLSRIEAIKLCSLFNTIYACYKNSSSCWKFGKITSQSESMRWSGNHIEILDIFTSY